MPCLCAALLWIPAAPAQEPTFSTGVDVVNVFVSVRDRDGVLIDDLTRDDFEVSEDGRLQQVRYFAANTDLPLTLALLFDISGSQRDVIEQQRRAAIAFTRQILRPGVDEAMVAGFNRRLDVLQPLTSSPSEVEAGLDRLEVPREADGQLASRAEGTALFEALRYTSGLLTDRPGRKAIVVLSDGIDTASPSDVDDAVEAAQRADVLVYTIRFYDRAVFAFAVRSAGQDNLRKGRRALEELSSKTGGGFSEIAEDRTLADNFARIDEELRHQYSLGFTPEATGGNPEDGYRKLRVRLSREARDGRGRGLTVQARDGYYP